jgi:hypothetical protein
MPIKTTLRFHLLPVRMAVIKKTTDAEEEKGKKHCWWQCKLVQPLWKSVCMFLKKAKMELPSATDGLLLGIYSKEYKSTYNRDACTIMIIAVLFCDRLAMESA